MYQFDSLIHLTPTGFCVVVILLIVFSLHDVINVAGPSSEILTV